MLNNHTIASGTSGVTAPSSSSQQNDQAAAAPGRLPDGSTVALVQAPQPLAAAAGLAGELFAPRPETAAAPSLPASPSPLAAIKASADFKELLSRLDAHTKEIRAQARYLPPRQGDRYEWLRPESRTVWPREQAWLQGTWLNGNTVSVQGRPIAVATQHPLPGESLNAFLMQLLRDRPPVIVVLGSDAEIASPQQRMPDYFRPSDSRADVSYIPPEGRHLQPEEHDVLGSYLAEGGMFTGESWVLTVQGVRPMSPLGEPGLGRISSGVIRINERPANPMRGFPPRSHELEVVHLRQTGKNGAMSCAELGWLGGKVAAARRSSDSLPILHCNSGAGRSAVVIAASVLGDPSSTASLEAVVRDIRRTRHAWALNAEDQIASLALFAQERGKPLLGAAPAMPLEQQRQTDPLALAKEMAMTECRTQ